MAFEVLDEHEQGELVRKWLRENFMSIVVGIGLGLVLIFGWQQWKAHRGQHAMEAALHYQSLANAYDNKRNDDAEKIAEALRKDFADTAYGVLTAMRQAEAAVDKKDLAGAAKHLEWAAQHAEIPAFKALVDLRLARVQLAQGDAAAALKLLDGVPQGTYAALADELRGDALTKLDRTEEARQAYQNSLTNLDPNASNRSFVQMKLDDLLPAPEKRS